MIPNQIMQSTIDGLKQITHKQITVLDREGKIVASTNMGTPHELEPIVKSFILSPADNQSAKGLQYFKVLDNGIVSYVVIVEGEDDETYRVGKITAFHVQSLILAYKERLDKDNFIKNLLLDNMLQIDISSRAKRLNIEYNVRRVVYYIETPLNSDTSTVEVLRGMFPDNHKDFVTAIDENSVILVKELSPKDNYNQVLYTANIIFDTLTSEIMSMTYISIGAVANDLKNVSSSLKEAKLAREVGKIFEPDKRIVSYERLGIGRLIYQLPPALCKIFIKEMLQDFSLGDIDSDMYHTVVKFFQNDLNVSETARELFIHRNTLVYRLDKLEQLTHLDLRNFSDAITFKITLMVNKYMQYVESLERRKTND